eukprot:29766-Eustigmatos_ZCMA.PRE.1
MRCALLREQERKGKQKARSRECAFKLQVRLVSTISTDYRHLFRSECFATMRRSMLHASRTVNLAGAAS